MQSIDQPLLGGTAKSHFKMKCNGQLCSVSSKAVLLILTWNFLVSFAVALFTSPDFYSLITSHNSANLIKVLTFGLSGFLLLFYPLATCLADRKWGRYKTIVNSLYCLLCTATVMCALGGALIAILAKGVGSQTMHIVLGALVLESFLFTLPSLIVFKANVIQFGVDQLNDQPSDIKTVYSYRYVWSSYAGTALLQIILSFSSSLITIRLPKLIVLFILVPIIIVLFLGATLIIQHYCKHHWFQDERTHYNPWKVICQIISYAIKNKDVYKLQCNHHHYGYMDLIPTTFDVGKNRYGGPFANDQVEDVKIFLKILRVLLALGPIFAVDIAASNQLPTVAYHLAGGSDTALLQPIKDAYSITYAKILALNGSITPLIITLIIPLYICLRQPCIDRHIPRTLKRVGLGMILILLSLISVLLLDTAEHVHFSSTTCYLVDDHNTINNTSLLEESPSISPLYITIPYTMNAFAYTLLYIGAYEFILSQSPHAMKGLLIGIFFAIKGVFQLLAVLTVYLPFISWSSDSSFPSCGFVYYLINVAIALIGITVYTWAAANYQYKQQESVLPERHLIDNWFNHMKYDEDESNSKHRNYNDCSNEPLPNDSKRSHAVLAAQKGKTLEHKAKHSTTRKFNNGELEYKAKHLATQKPQSLEYAVKQRVHVHVEQKRQSLEYKVKRNKNCVPAEPGRRKKDHYPPTSSESEICRDSSLRRPRHRNFSNNSLIYKVKDDNDIQTCSETDDELSTPQATNANDQENATGNNRMAKIELPDHICSRNKSEQ